MADKVWKKIVVLTLLVLVSAFTLAQKNDNTSGRWRLKFDLQEAPKPIIIDDGDGQKNVYWYCRYQITNDTERDIPWMISIKIVVDKTREGVSESQVPGLFYRAEIPEEAGDKKVDREAYVNQLRAYHDTDFLIVKKQIMEQLRLYPALNEKEKAVLAALEAEKAKAIEEIMKQTNLSYAETENALLNLVMRNLVMSQETTGNPIFFGSNAQGAIFSENNQEAIKKPGDKVAGWELLAIDKDTVMMKKDDVVTKFGKGSTLEFLYIKTNRHFVEKDMHYTSGMASRGVYKGLASADPEASKRFAFQHNVIPKKSVRHGLAIFQDISPQMDFMAIVVSGLVDPLVRRQGKIYLENEVFMIGYSKGRDETSGTQESLTQLYQRWIVLSSKETTRK